jgi:hypothetical protein
VTRAPLPVRTGRGSHHILPRELDCAALLTYSVRMTKLLDQALEAVRRLPRDTQDEIARTMLELVDSEVLSEAIDAAHLPAVLEGLEQAKCGEFASDSEVEAAFRRFDP